MGSITTPAVSSDLSISSSKRTDISHLYHGSSEITQKSCIIGTVTPNLSIGRSTIEELLIRMEKSALIHKVLIVIISKLIRALYVKRSQVCVTTRSWTICLTSSSECRVYVGVIIYVSTEVGTLSLAYGVAT